MVEIIQYHRHSAAFEEALKAVEQIQPDAPANDDNWVIDKHRLAGLLICLGGAALSIFVMAPLLFRIIASIIAAVKVG